MKHGNHDNEANLMDRLDALPDDLSQYEMLELMNLMHECSAERNKVQSEINDSLMQGGSEGLKFGEVSDTTVSLMDKREKLKHYGNKISAVLESFETSYAKRKAHDDHRARIRDREHKGEQVPRYDVKFDLRFIDFKSIEVTKIDETKPWKPALEVRVIDRKGAITEGLSADTPFFTFVDHDANEMTVSAAVAGHIDTIHIKGEDAGSVFSYSSLRKLFEDVTEKMPENIAHEKGESAFDIEMGKPMGKEGFGSMMELKDDGVLSDQDISVAQSVKTEVKRLNKEGSNEEKNAFIEKFKTDHSDSKIQFQIIRGSVLVPIVDTPKKETTKLFMVFGPNTKGNKTLKTAAPGRYMPRHPDPDKHKSTEGVLDEKTFEESAEAWFDTVMLIGK